MNFPAFEGIILADMRKQEFEETTQKVERKLEKEVYKWLFLQKAALS